MQFMASGGGMAGGDMSGGGSGNLFSNWAPSGDYICADEMGGFWNMSTACDGDAVQFLYLNKTNSTLVLGSDFALTKNDDKADDGGGSYTFDNSSTAGIRTVNSYQWQDASYRFKRTSTNQTFDVITWSADYWPDTGSVDVFQGMMIDIMPGADQFSNQTGGTGSGGQTSASGGAFDKDSLSTGGQPTIGAFTFSTSTPLKSSCSSSMRFEMKFIDSDTLEFQTFTGCSSGTTGGTGTGVIGYDFTISTDTLTKVTYDLINSAMGSQTGYYATMTEKYITSSGVTYAGSDTVKHTAFYPESSSVLWWQSLLSDKASVTSQGMVTTKFE
jgi:hypothetical protein